MRVKGGRDQVLVKSCPSISSFMAHRPLPATFPVGALMSLRSTPSTIRRRGVMVPWAMERARPRRSRILARACSRVMVGVRAGLDRSKVVPVLLWEGVRRRSWKDESLRALSSWTGTVVVVVTV